MGDEIGRASARERPVRRGMRMLARVGYSAEGIVYLAVGMLAAFAAVNARREPADAESALAIVSSATVGTGLLWGVGFGLAALALWDLLVAVLHIEAVGWRGRALVQRGSSVFAALFHGGLAGWAIQRARGGTRPAGDQAADQMSASIMAQPFGRWLLVAIAGLIFLFALTEIVEAWSPGVTARLSSALTTRARRAAALIGRLGITARAGVVALVGWFVLRAGLTNRSSEARGIGDSLQALDLPAIGPLLLGGVALGLVLFGVWQLLNAVLARIEVS